MVEHVMMNQDTARVLMVDDDPVLRLFAREALQAIGFDVVEASDGVEAMRAIEVESIDLMILDVDMPHMDGFEVCECLRQRRDTAELPIMIATGLTDFEAMDRAFEVGATDFITKPFSPRILQQRARFLVRAGMLARRLRRSEQRLANSQRLARIGNWDWDFEKDEFSCSEEVYRILERPRGNGALDQAAFMNVVHPEDRPALEDAFRLVREEGRSFLMDHRIFTESGAVRNVHHQAEVSGDEPNRKHVVSGIIQDITRRKRAEEQILRLGYFDSLTGLPNRRMLSERLDRTLEAARRDEEDVALLFLDLDQFKRINDTLGHAIGDQLLTQVAERLVDCVRSSDFVSRGSSQNDSGSVARLGGDEFTVVLNRVRSADDGATVARRILEQMQDSFAVADHKIVVSVSIGISLFPNDGATANELLRSADVAMYQAKDEGRNGFRFYRASMNERVAKNLRIETLLREALENDYFVLHYQPRIECATGEVTGVEALIRLEHPIEGMMPPGDFIPVAEDTGLIDQLGLWVLRSACLQNKAWQDLGFRPICVAVNVSTHQIRKPGLVSAVESILRETGLDPKHLELEITESVFIEDEEQISETLRRLKAMGLRLAIDDFGTGYSSMSYLKRLPFDMLKIDRAFVSGVEGDPENSGIVSAVIAMSRELGLTVIAEGVETREEEEFLRNRGCDAFQGFLFGRPMPSEVFVARLTAEGPEVEPSS
jgi:diguanylate cyclase (GGDEF)-like protein